jgi:hypothetical protein
MAELIITNGDSAADLLAAAGATATILPWRDVLHEGPIAAAGLAELSALRAPFLARRFHLPGMEVAATFADRDAVMAGHGDFDTVTLWFEHDLYDQLQLAQILAFFAGEKRTDGLTLVQADDFLGRQSARTILRFAERARAVTALDLGLGVAAWAALAAPTPEAVRARLDETTRGPLPYLAPALARFLEELPSPANGLGRTEQAILDYVDAGVGDPRALFAQVIADEAAAFMGDWSFLRLIEDLADCEVPLLTGLPPAEGNDPTGRFADAVLALTMAGEAVMAGEDDHVALSGVDGWWGGTRLLGRSVWRYDRAARRLVAPGKTEA